MQIKGIYSGEDAAIHFIIEDCLTIVSTGKRIEIRGKIRVKRAKCEVVGKKKEYGIDMSI